MADIVYGDILSQPIYQIPSTLFYFKSLLSDLGGNPIIGHGRSGSTVTSTIFQIFRSNSVAPYFMPDLTELPFPQNKIGLSLSHLVPEILEPKIDLISNPKCII